MAAPLVPDALWAIIEPLIPLDRPKPKGGRTRVSDRAALTGIIFVLRTGISWKMLAAKMGCGSGMTCWRRAPRVAADRHLGPPPPGAAHRLALSTTIDWRRAAVDSASIAAKKGRNNRSEPDGPRQAGIEGKRHRGCQWHPAHREDLGRQTGTTASFSSRWSTPRPV